MAISDILFLFNQMEESMDNDADIFRLNGLPDVADRLELVADFFGFLASFGDDVEMAMREADENGTATAALQGIGGLVAGYGANVAVVAAIGGTVAATVGATGALGLVLGAAATVAIAQIGAFAAGFLNDMGITFLAKDIDVSSLEGPLIIAGTINGDTFTTTSESDQITARGGDDTISNVGGSDKIDGGTGLDTVSYKKLALNGPNGIVLDNRSAPDALTVFHGTSRDTLTNVEIIIGTDRADTFRLGNLGHNLAPGIFDGYIREVSDVSAYGSK